MSDCIQVSIISTQVTFRYKRTGDGGHLMMLWVEETCVAQMSHRFLNTFPVKEEFLGSLN